MNNDRAYIVMTKDGGANLPLYVFDDITKAEKYAKRLNKKSRYHWDQYWVTVAERK